MGAGPIPSQGGPAPGGPSADLQPGLYVGARSQATAHPGDQCAYAVERLVGNGGSLRNMPFARHIPQRAHESDGTTEWLPEVRNSRVQRVRGSECLNAVTQPGKVRIGVGNQCLGDDVSDLTEGRFPETARCQRRGADPQA